MQNQDNQKPVTAQALMDDDQINLMDILLVIAKYNRFIIMFTVISAILGVVYALRQPTIYTAKTAIMPPQVAQPMAANLLGQLGNLGLIGGGGGGVVRGVGVGRGTGRGRGAGVCRGVDKGKGIGQC